MSISTTRDSDDSIPIAKELNSKRIIYLTPEKEQCEPDTRRQFDGRDYHCNQCGKTLTSQHGYKYHITKICVIKPKYTFVTTKEIDPLPTEKRQVIYIAGSQESGKSYRVMRYMTYWLKLFPERKIIVISRLDNDETFGELEKHIVRLQPNIKWIEEKFNLDDFQDCLVIFDDIVSSKWSDNPDPKKSMKENKMIQDYIRELAVDICQNGRHHNTQLIITSHDLYDKEKTSKILKDATHMIIFIGTTGIHHLQYFLKEYCGLVRNQMNQVLSLKSRWIMISKNDPKYIMYSHGIFRYDVLGLKTD